MNTSVDTYIHQFSKETQVILEKIRQTIRSIIPEATETISYGIPAFDLFGKHVVHFAAFKNHIGFFPTPSAIVFFSKELNEYHTSKGTIQFPMDKPIPYELIEKITNFRRMEVETKRKKLVSTDHGSSKTE